MTDGRVKLIDDPVNEAVVALVTAGCQGVPEEGGILQEGINTYC